MHNFTPQKIFQKICIFMMQINLTSFNIPLEICKHMSCTARPLKICRSTQIQDLMNSSYYNKNFKKSTLCIIRAHTVHFFNIKFSSKHKIHHFQIDTNTIFKPAYRTYNILRCFSLLTQMVFDTCIYIFKTQNR